MSVRIGLTPGDPTGIGPEVLQSALAAVAVDAKFTLFGPPSTLGGQAGDHQLRVGPHRVQCATPDAAATLPLPAAGAALEMACAAAARGELDALCTGPIRKASLHDVPGGPFPGHTEYLGVRLGLGPAAYGADAPLMVFAGGPFLLGLCTVHVPLRAVADAITPARVQQKLAALADVARRVHGVQRPRIVVLGLNPHAGEAGALGYEEHDVIGPACARFDAADVVGPLPADGFFGHLDTASPPHAVLAMYHDQGLAPYKLLTQGAGVNITWGLPIVRTSPDHGTAIDIAGTGRASDASMRAALRWAHRLALSSSSSSSRT